MQDVRGCLSALKSLSYPAHRFQLFITYLNRDLARSENDLFGMVVHVGSYSTREKAESARAKICSLTRGPAVYLCTSGCPVPLELINKDTVVFGADINATSEEIENAARRSVEAKNKEMEEAKLASMTEEGKLATARQRIAEITAQIKELESALDDLVSFVRERESH